MSSLESYSRKFYWRFYRLVALAVIIMMAVLTGSLLLGDSVRGTLVQRVGERLGHTETIIASGTGFLGDTVTSHPLMAHARGYLLVDGFVSVDEKLLPVYVWGTDADSLLPGEALVNEPLSAKLPELKSLILHLPAHNMVPSGSLFVTQRYATQMRLNVTGVKSIGQGGNLLLKNEQTLPLNVFVNRQYLAEAMELEGNVFVKPTAQSHACMSFGMARKGGMKSKQITTAENNLWNLIPHLWRRVRFLQYRKKHRKTCRTEENFWAMQPGCWEPLS